MPQLTETEQRQLAHLKRMRQNFADFARNCLKVRTKSGETVPFELNEAQQHIEKKLREQHERMGKVRVLILKGRQQGVSTYVGGRFYHRASMRKGVNVYILSHEQASSDALFDIVDRYHRLNPMAPHTAVANVKEMLFDRLDSSYQVATAGQKAGGRGRTISLFHGSEVAFWNNAPLHFAASVQAVPDAEGTEIILESTANGPSGEFYERCQDAIAGRGDYELIFIPWFWSSEYRRPDLVTPEFELDSTSEEGELSEVEYAEMHGLDNAQMAWRRNKIYELRSVRLFKQEYPATPDEAFQSSQTDSFISAAHVLRARKRTVEPGGPLVFGVDPAGPGGDRFAVAARQGYCVPWIKWRDKIDAVEANQWLKSLIDEHDPQQVFIDAGGIGHATISLLRAEGREYARVVSAVNFGGTSQFKLATPKQPGPKNRRAEMWQRMRDYVESDEGASIPDMDALQADLIAPRVKATLTNDLLLESKDEMRKRGIRSPDLADAVALTFASLRLINRPGARGPQSADPLSGDPGSAPRRVQAPSGALGPNGWMG